MQPWTQMVSESVQEFRLMVAPPKMGTLWRPAQGKIMLRNSSPNCISARLEHEPKTAALVHPENTVHLADCTFDRGLVIKPELVKTVARGGLHTWNGSELSPVEGNGSETSICVINEASVEVEIKTYHTRDWASLLPRDVATLMPLAVSEVATEVKESVQIHIDQSEMLTTVSAGFWVWDGVSLQPDLKLKVAPSDEKMLEAESDPETQVMIAGRTLQIEPAELT